MTEIQQADPDARRKAVWLYCICMLGGLALLIVYSIYEEQLLAWLVRNLDRMVRHRSLAAILCLLLAAPLLVLSGSLWCYGGHCVRTRRMPPPGYAVIRPTAVRTGTAALRWGRIVQVLALVCALAGAALPVVVWTVLSTLNA